MLRDEFARLREALDGLSFLYTVAGHDGEDASTSSAAAPCAPTLPAPRTAAAAPPARRAWPTRCFGAPEPGGALVPSHQVDEILLLAHWFRTHPDELERTVRPPGDAARAPQRLSAGLAQPLRPTRGGATTAALRSLRRTGDRCR